jgi:hypothetical protein
MHRAGTDSTYKLQPVGLCRRKAHQFEEVKITRHLDSDTRFFCRRTYAKSSAEGCSWQRVLLLNMPLVNMACCCTISCAVITHGLRPVEALCPFTFVTHFGRFNPHRTIASSQVAAHRDC